MTLKTIDLPEAIEVRKGDSLGFLSRADTAGMGLVPGQATIMFAIDNGAIVMLSGIATPVTGDTKIFSDFEVAFTGTYHSPPSAKLMPSTMEIQKQVTSCVTQCNLAALVTYASEESVNKNATQMAVVLTDREEFQGGGGIQTFYVCVPVTMMAFAEMEAYYRAAAAAIDERLAMVGAEASSKLANKIVMPTPGQTQ